MIRDYRMTEPGHGSTPPRGKRGQKLVHVVLNEAMLNEVRLRAVANQRSLAAECRHLIGLGIAATSNVLEACE